MAQQKREVVTVLKGNAEDLKKAFNSAGTDADQFRAKVEKLNALKLEQKVLKVDTNLAAVESDILRMKGTGVGAADALSTSFGSRLKGALGGLTQQFTPASAGAEQLASGLGAGSVAAGAFAGGVGVLALGVKASVTAFTDQAAAISKFAQVTQTSATDASDLVNALDDVGISGDQSTAAFAKLGKSIPTKQFAELGIEVAKNADGTTNMVQTFDNVLKKMDATKDATERNKIAATAFGKSWVDLTAILDKGSAGFEKSLASNKGLRLSEADLKSAKDFKASMDELGDAIKKIEMAAARVAMPFLKLGIDDATKLIGVVDALGDKLTRLPGKKVLGDLADSFLDAAIPGKALFDMLPGGKKKIDDVGASAHLAGAELGGMAQNLGAVQAEMGSMPDTSGYDDRYETIQQRKNQSYKDNIALLKTRTQEENKSAAATKSATEVLLDNIRAEDSRLASAKAVADARQRVADVEKSNTESITRAQEALDAVRAKGPELADRTAKAERDVAKARKEVADANADVTAKELELSRVAHGTTENTAELTAATKDLDSARKASQGAAQRVLDLEREIATTRAENAINGPKKAEAANRTLIRSQDSVQDAVDRVAQIEQELNDMRSGATQATAREVASKERDLITARLDVEDATIRAAEAQDALTKAQQDAADPAAGTQKLEEDLVEARKTAKEKTDEEATATQKLYDLRAGHGPGTKEYIKAEQDVNDARDKAAGLIETQKGKEAELAAARKAELQLPKDIAKAQGDLTTAYQDAARDQKAAIDGVTAALHAQYVESLTAKAAIEKLGGGGTSPAGGTAKSGGAVPSVGSTALNTVGNFFGGDSSGAVLAKARAAIGISEGAEANKWLGNTIDTAVIPWCQAAVNEIFDQAGVNLPNGDVLGTRESFSRLKAAGLQSSAPVVGGLAYKTRGDGKGHVGIVESYNAKTGMVTTIEGNSSNQVKRNTSKASSWDLGFIDPDAKQAAKNTSKTAKTTEDQLRESKTHGTTLNGIKYGIDLWGRGQDENFGNLINTSEAQANRIVKATESNAQFSKDFSDSFFAKLAQDYPSGGGSSSGGSSTSGTTPAVEGRRATESLDEYRKRVDAAAKPAEPAEKGSPGADWYWDGSAWVKYNTETGAYDRVEDKGRYAREHRSAANGALVRATSGGTLVNVGEAGADELVSPVPTLQRVIRQELAMSGGGGVTIANFTFAPVLPSVTDVQSLVRQAAPLLIDEIDRINRRR